MSFTNEDVTEGQLEELSLFTLPAVQTGIERVYFVDSRPTSQLTTQDAVIDFNISGNGVDYLDLKRSRLYVKLKIVHDDGSPLMKDDEVCIGNNLLHTLWGQIDISLGRKLITSSDNEYPYKAYLNALMNYGHEAQQYQLQTHLFCKDTRNSLDTTDIRGSNFGLYERLKRFAESRSVEMEDFLFRRCVREIRQISFKWRGRSYKVV